MKTKREYVVYDTTTGRCIKSCKSRAKALDYIVKEYDEYMDIYGHELSYRSVNIVA